MAPAHGTPFKGAVRYQKKQEMLAIATSLGLKVDPSTHTRESLEELITKELRARRSELESDPLYEKLYESYDRDARRENGDSESDASPEHYTRSPRKVAGRKSVSSAGAAASHAAQSVSHNAAEAATTVRETAASASSAARETAASASAAVQDAAAQARRSTHEARAQIETIATQAAESVTQQAEEVRREGNALLKRGRKEYKKYEKVVLKQMRRARVYASDVRHITAALLVLEAILLVQSVVPTYTLAFGQSRFQSIKNRLTGHSWLAQLPQYAFSVPQPQALITLAVWRPLLLWAFWSFAIPYVAAHIVTFGAKESHSLFTFNFTRLFVLFYLVLVVPRSTDLLSSAAGLFNREAFSYDHVLDHVDGGVSLLLTGLATGFTVYDSILKH